MIGGTAPARAASGTCSVTAGCGRPAAVKAASIRSRRHLRANSGRNSARSAHQAVRCSSAQPGAYGLDSPEHSFAAAPAALRCRRKRRPGAAQAQTRGKGGAVLEPATRLPVDRQHGHGQARHACISALNADVSPARCSGSAHALRTTTSWCFGTVTKGIRSTAGLFLCCSTPWARLSRTPHIL